MATVYINDKPIDIGTERLNLVQAAQRAGVLIPHYCWHPALTVVASCRMCLVEVGEKKPDGTVAMQPRVVPACQTPAKDGTVCITNSQKARYSQEQTLESILLNHPLDCPVCDKAGECGLQDYSFNFGRSESRMIDEKNHPPNKPNLSEKIALFTDRCIMCSRCVRFTREIAGTAELQVINRGNHSEIDIFPGEPLNNKLAGNVVDLCPVGALCSKDFLYKQRVWYLKSQKSVCADCSTGCSVYVDENKDIVYRLRPRENPQAQGYFICDEGRYGFHYLNAPERLRQPQMRSKESEPAPIATEPRRPVVFARTGEFAAPTEIWLGRLVATNWNDVIPRIRKDLTDAVRADGSAIAGVLSPFLTCEEAYLLGKYLKGLSGEVRLALGPVPVIGKDDTYPKNRRGVSQTPPIEPVKFTIRAEKCPNRRGVEEVLKHFQGEVIPFASILSAAGEGRLKALYLAASYPPREGGWITEDAAKALEKVPLVIVQDLFASSASSRAHYVLPGGAFAEKDGTFVNHAGLAQAVRPAVRPPHDVRVDARIFLDLLERGGLPHGPTLRKQLAAEVPYFAALAGGDLGELGIMLGTKQK
ncbi:ferredoxin [Planctomycetaceae bacterium SCGC AG-212-D15]|nr:ferredoxin [Planctomycetaceae bacterium SCGC AG-212-D15]